MISYHIFRSRSIADKFALWYLEDREEAIKKLKEVLAKQVDKIRRMTIELVTSLPTPFVDALWQDDGSLLTIRALGNRTLLEHRDARLELFNSQFIVGTPLRVLETGGEITIVTQSSGQPRFTEFVPTDDVDNDGVNYLTDDFPKDPAASVDRDLDGAPDNWNPGYQQSDSTTGLVIDAFPLDSACQLPEHAVQGQADMCDIASRISTYYPDHLEVDDAGVIYLLDDDTNRVYRWSLEQDRLV